MGEAVKDVQVLEPRVSCVTTESCEGVGDVRVHAQNEICESAKGMVEMWHRSRTFGRGRAYC